MNMKKLITTLLFLCLASITFAGWEVVEDQTRLLSPDGSETLRMYRDIDNDNVYFDWTFGDLIMRGGNVILSGGATTDVDNLNITGAIKVRAGAQLLPNNDFSVWEGNPSPDDGPINWIIDVGPRQTGVNELTDASPGMRVRSSFATVGIARNDLVIGKEYLLILTYSIRDFGLEVFNGSVLVLNLAFDSSTFTATDTSLSITTNPTEGGSDNTLSLIELYELTAGPVDNYASNGTHNSKTKYTSAIAHADGVGGSETWDLWWDGSADWVLSLAAGTEGVSYWNRSNLIQLGAFTPNGNAIGSAFSSSTSTLTVDGVTVTGLDASTGVYTDAQRGLTSTAPSSGILGYWTRTGTTLSMVSAADLLSLGGDVTAVGTVTGGTFTDGTAILTDGNLTGVDSILFDLTPVTAAPAEGLMYWNADDGTLNLGMPGGTVNQQIGQEFLVRVTNGTGSQIDNGTPVYISSATGTNIIIAPADADFAGGIGFRTFAVTTEDIVAGQKGYVTTQGFVREMDTSFAVAAGLPAYLASGGGFTTTIPSAPDITYLVGIVTVAHASAGEMYVIQTSVPNLNSLSDVDPTSLANFSIPQWNNSANTYETLTTLPGITLGTPWALAGDGAWTGTSTLDLSDAGKIINLGAAHGYVISESGKGWLQLVPSINSIIFGNATDNPNVSFLGSGTVSVDGNTELGNTAADITTINAEYTLPQVDGAAGDIIKTDGAGVATFATPTSHTQISFSMYDAEPARSSETSLDGAFNVLATAQPLDSVPTDLVVSKGTGKTIVAINAGSDFAGEITVTGTSVDRDTGATTGADTDTLTIDALTTDDSDTDANGNDRHAFTGAYITSKWFVGTVTLSTTNLTLTDVDVYHVSFEQFDDTASITVDTFDANLLTTSVNAEFDAYLYSITVTGDKCNIARIASLNVGADGETALADRYWRLRRGNLNIAIDGTTDGTWVDVHYSNSPAFVEDVSIKVWATEIVPLTLD